MAQEGEIGASDVPPSDAHQLGAQPLARVRFRAIGLKALQRQPLRHAMSQALLRDLTAMNRGAIPANAHPADSSRRRCCSKATTSAEVIMRP